MAATDLGTLKLEDFSPHVNEDFEIKFSQHDPAQLKLAEAVAVGGSSRDGGGFSLHFVGGVAGLPQGVYPMEHGKLGTLEIFLVPTGPEPNGHGYHAVFG